ncbi:NAD(P)-binding protein [Pseudovirgaria hyperparasitica]|uniref:NAD(P)-binding protein n=1 Tax=Pseudovirgaria hyperparasitica TaxID=470096 RepID=A0A6A6WIJ8_9PEZI|nr:NAD(P)-binding protein [Pseudovirgaria hyperparasitica]KAF2762099.1 NAD(P)-binding protein [Pseudovirgaria hyperparasitica]
MSLRDQNAIVTGASMGIGREIAKSLAAEGCNVVLFARTAEKLEDLTAEIQKTATSKVIYRSVDVQQYDSVKAGVDSAVNELGEIDILVNNAGLALGAPNRFHELSIDQIVQMNGTNMNGYMFAAYAVLNASMAKRKTGTILNVSSTTALEAPPFPGEAVYHSNKAFQEGFSNSLRNELCGTNIRVLVLRPGVVATNFHEQRVGYDKDSYDNFMQGFQPLTPDQIAPHAIWMLKQPNGCSVKALDVIPTAQRSLNVFDREWNSRHS